MSRDTPPDVTLNDFRNEYVKRYWLDGGLLVRHPAANALVYGGVWEANLWPHCLICTGLFWRKRGSDLCYSSCRCQRRSEASSASAGGTTLAVPSQRRCRYCGTLETQATHCVSCGAPR